MHKLRFYSISIVGTIFERRALYSMEYSIFSLQEGNFHQNRLCICSFIIDGFFAIYMDGNSAWGLWRLS